MKTTLNGSRHIVMPKRRLRIHRASNEIPFFSRNRQRRENAKMPPKKKMKPIAGQQTIAAAFSVPTTTSSVSCWSPPLVAGRGPVIEPIRYGHTNRVTRVRGVQTRHFEWRWSVASSFFILGGNSNIVTPLNAFMETFLARNVHFTFIMFARWMWRMFGLIVMTKSERSVHLHGQSLWMLSNLNVLADNFSPDQHYECWKHTRHTMWSYSTRLLLFISEII